MRCWSSGSPKPPTGRPPTTRSAASSSSPSTGWPGSGRRAGRRATTSCARPQPAQGAGQPRAVRAARPGPVAGLPRRRPVRRLLTGFSRKVDAVQLAELLVAKASGTVAAGGTEVRVGLSAGVAVCAGRALDAPQLVAGDVPAARTAEAAGGGRVEFTAARATGAGQRAAAARERAAACHLRRRTDCVLPAAAQSQQRTCDRGGGAGAPAASRGAWSRRMSSSRWPRAAG
jgi:hypothetical protein